MSNLLEKASILLTPTAYDDGKILSVKPEEVLGNELVTNGDFSNGSTGWTIINGTVTDKYNASMTAYQSGIRIAPFSNSGTFKVVFDLVVTSGSCKFDAGGSNNAIFNTSGTKEIIVTNTTKFEFNAFNLGWVGTLDNISVKEQIDGDFDFTRNSSATRVNSEGLIEDVQILSSNLVSNGDFSQEGSEEVTNGDFSNGSTDWNSEQGIWTFGDSVVNGNGANGSSEELTQSAVTTVGKNYNITYEVLNYVSGSVQILGSEIGYVSGNGVYTSYYSASSSTLKFRPINFNGSITNVSVKEVGQDWSITGTGWNISDNGLSGLAAEENVTQSISTIVGKKYVIKFTISNWVSGDVYVRPNNSAGTQFYVNGNGTYTEEFTGISSSPTLVIRARPSIPFTGTISNISVVEITDDTNLPRINYEGFSYQDSLGSELVNNGDFSDGTNGWNAAGGGSISVSNNKLTLEGNNDFNFYARQTVSGYEVGKQYRIEVDVAGGNTSRMQVGIYGEGLIFNNQPIVLGKLSAIFTITSGSNGSRFLDISNRNDDGLNDTLIINSVSVKEYLGQEVVPDSGCGSWLFEPQSTNLITQSENFSSVDWTKTLVTASANDAASPSGGVNASLIQETVYTSSIPSLKTTNNIPISTGKHTLSFYVKNNNGRYLGISFGNNANRIRTTFDFDTETFKTPLFNGITEGEVSYTTIGDYYRILITANFTSSISGLVFIMPIATDTYPFYAFQNSDNRSFYLWGAQIEEQSFATSYIPTSGSTVTRLQDAANGAGSSDLINSTEGVLYAEIAALADDGTNRIIGLFKDGDATNRVNIFYRSGSNRMKFVVRVNNTNLFDTSITLSNITNYNKVALSFKENEFKVYINGVKEAEQLSGSIYPTDTLDKLGFNQNISGGSPFYGKTKCVAVFKEALTDAELTCLTTI